MRRDDRAPAFRVNGPIWNLVTIVLGMVAAYFMTIQQIKVELAAKAETTVVETLDKKLTSVEVYLKEAVVNKQQFYEHTQNMESRLDRIEHYLIEQTGDSRGKR
jgi:hypothetical protein